MLKVFFESLETLLVTLKTYFPENVNAVTFTYKVSHDCTLTKSFQVRYFETF
jgi:hypothetical protein